MAENLIVRLQVAVDSVRGLVESLDRVDEANADRISQLESVVRQLLNRWEMLAIRASSCTALRPIRSLPAYEISIHQLEFLGNRMRFNWPQISRMLLVFRTTLWRIIRNVESFSSRCHFTTISDSDLDELIRLIRQGFPDCGISMMGHLRSRNIFLQRHTPNYYFCLRSISTLSYICRNMIMTSTLSKKTFINMCTCFA